MTSVGGPTRPNPGPEAGEHPQGPATEGGAAASETHFSLRGRDIVARLGQSGFSSVASRLRGVIAMPAALLVIGTDGYGTLTASFALGSILGSFATLGLPDAVGRLVVGCDDPGTALRMVQAVRTLGLRTMSVLSVIALGCVIAGTGPVILWGSMIGVSASMFKLGTVHLEYFQRTARLLRLSLVNNYGSLALAIAGGLLLGFTGFMAGSVIGTAIAALIGWRTLSVSETDRRRSLPAGFWKAAARLTALLLPVVLSQWAMVSLASLLIYSRLNADQAGAYSTAYSLSSVGLIMVGAIAGVWASTVQRIIHEDLPRAIKVGARIAAVTAAIGGVAVLVTAFAAPIATDMLGSGKLAGAPACVPWLIASFTMLAIAQVPMGMIYALDRTHLITAGTLISSVVSIGALWVWIGSRGIIGASQATLLGYSVLFICMTASAWVVIRALRHDAPVTQPAD